MKPLVPKSKYSNIARSLCAATLVCAAGSVSGQAVQPREEEAIRPPDPWLNPNRLDLNVFGFSYHPDRETVHRMKLDNEFNPGLGIRYQLHDTARGTAFTEVGAYRDSGRNWAKFAGVGYQFKVGEHWRIGGALAVLNSRTYNDGITFMAMVPLVTYDFGSVKLNAAYFPKFGHYNEVASFGLYFSIPFSTLRGQ